MEQKDNFFYNNPSQSPNFGHYNPLVPASLSAQLAAMKLQSHNQKEHGKQQENSGQRTWENYRTKLQPW
ncbi:hypothetical protein TSUD_323930 [Trifolium subterraneum]|uniref:Uncharacterized protein n=1 Tax=Trifolium subterraneum TaxID=3900 RepID=A0A2Z6MT12_TRISU|nr:hypothetical protein TSUD_323930 [Trifolium subterraneum]